MREAPRSTLRPADREIPPPFVGYVARIAEDEEVLAVLEAQLAATARISDLPEARGNYRYQPGKWSLKEVVGHLSDTERVFAYRALRIGRGDATPLPGFDDQAYVPEMGAAERTLTDIVEEWSAVRHATLALFRSLPLPAWERLGVASGQEISVRALAHVIAGHTRHHLEVVAARYTGGADGASPR